jgi:hypothetical protein
MSEINIFIVPTEEPLKFRKGLGKTINEYLENKGITEGLYDQDLGWLAAGNNSGVIFPNINISQDDAAFEYAIIYNRDAAHFVPDAHSGGFGAKCTACNTELDDILYEFLDEQGEGDNAIDVSSKSLLCPECNLPNPLVSLDTAIETCVSKFYLCFCVVDEIKVNPKIIKELEALVGSKLKIIPERL